MVCFIYTWHKVDAICPLTLYDGDFSRLLNLRRDAGVNFLAFYDMSCHFSSCSWFQILLCTFLFYFSAMTACGRNRKLSIHTSLSLACTSTKPSGSTRLSKMARTDGSSSPSLKTDVPTSVCTSLASFGNGTWVQYRSATDESTYSTC